MSEQITGSPAQGVADHTGGYLEPGGKDGGERRRGVPTLLLTTTDRRSGGKRRTALIYGLDGARFVVVASKAGAPEHPSWYLNLEADPRVELRVTDETSQARAEIVTGEERTRLWALMCTIWPLFDDYQAGTDREIPVVALTPSN